MNESFKRPRDSDESVEEHARKQPKFSSYADCQPIVVSDDDEDDADDNYNNEIKSDRQRKSRVVTLKVRYPPESTTALPEHYAAPAVEGREQTLQTTIASVKAPTPNHPISNTTHKTAVDETKQEEPAARPNQPELVPSLMAAIQIDEARAQQWLALQVQSHRLIHADILRENQELMRSGEILVEDNKDLRHKIKELKESRELDTWRIGGLERQVRMMEEKVQAVEDEAGRSKVQADREKAQLEQTIQELQEQLSEYRKIKEAMVALQ